MSGDVVQLIGTVVLMYSVVGGAGYWMVRKQRAVKAALATDEHRSEERHTNG